MALPDIVFALTGDVRRNSRALKQLHVLAALGLGIEVLSLGAPGASPFPEGNIRVQYLPPPQGHGPRRFARIHALFTKATRLLRACVYHASDLYTLAAMGAAARRTGGSLIYDARELYTRVASTTGRPWTTAVWRMIEGHHIRRAEAIFTVSDSIAQHLVGMYGIAPPIVLHNVPPVQSVIASGVLRKTANIDPDTVVLLHQGQIQKARGCFLLAHAMREVRGGTLVFLGGGPLESSLRHFVHHLGLEDRVRFLDAVPPDKLLSTTACADIGVTLLENTCLNHRYALPNKLFEYLMAGLPVLASNLPEIRGVVEPFDVGCIVNPADRTALVRTLQYMIDENGARERWASNTSRVFETFSWETASHRFREVYSSLLSL